MKDGGEGLEMAQELLMQSAPNAIVCSSDLVALKTLRATSIMGLDVPRDLSVIG